FPADLAELADFAQNFYLRSSKICGKYFKDNAQPNNNKMENKSFTATIIVNKDKATAFNAIQNFRGWWSEEIEGNSNKLNEEFFYHYKDVHLCKLKLIESIPGERLVYLILDNQFNFIDDKTEWVNTKLVFQISQSTSGNPGHPLNPGKNQPSFTSESNDQTIIQFTHEGLVPEYECYKVCNDAWTGYITKSLRSYIDTGKGTPNPKVGEGFNAELVEKWKLKPVR
ncbi:MAG: hypothetical protein ACO1G6_01080, partial [Bacteroidota bacterium]